VIGKRGYALMPVSAACHWATQEMSHQLAKASGVQQSEISRIERRQGNPTYRTLQALAQAVHMTFGFVDSKSAGDRRGTRQRGDSAR
jgi:transcriptional regulator with XRE-family HTH domain